MDSIKQIEERYDEIISFLQEKKKEYLEENPDINEFEAEDEVIDDYLNYFDDQTYVLGHALINGYIKAWKDFHWVEISDMLASDMRTEEH